MAARWWSCSRLSIAPAIPACRCVCRYNIERALSAPASSARCAVSHGQFASSFRVAPPTLEQNGANNNQSLDDLLRIVRDVHEVHDVADEGAGNAKHRKL